MNAPRHRKLVDWVLYLAVVNTVLVGACAPAASPTNETDAGTEASASAGTCASACTNLRSHQCPLGQPTKKGVSCESWCQTIQTDNAGAGFPIVCLNRARTCAEADACR